MNYRKWNPFFLLLAFNTFWCTGMVYASYNEGNDTTDTAGYGLDSTFRISSANNLEGQRLASYSRNGSPAPIGAFNSSFDEIKLAADSIPFDPKPSARFDVFIFPTYTYCFVLKKAKDSTYSKIQVTAKLPDNRYIFKYGTNTTPNNRVLENSTYDRTIRYKPNNLFYRFTFMSTNSFSWEPPLPNNNHLLGYIVYVQNKNTPIDTSLPINLAQWDSIGFTDSTHFTYSFNPHAEYFNIVAVYSEGKSEFLKGWTGLFISSSINNQSPRVSMPDNFIIKRKTDGCSIVLKCPVGASSLSIYSLTGKQVAHFENITSTPVLLNTKTYDFTHGLYLIKTRLADGNVISKPLILTW